MKGNYSIYCSPSAARREMAALIRECLPSAPLRENQALEPIPLRGTAQLRISPLTYNPEG